jgi:hypothetical protein
LVVGSAGAAGAGFFILFIARTSKKMTKATMRKSTMDWMNKP